MSVADRLRAYVEQEKISISAFEKSLGLSNGYIRNLKGTPNISKLELILKTYPALNRVWLLTGEGEMLNTSSQSEDIAKLDIYTVPLLPITAHGGTLNEFVVSVLKSECEQIVSPIKGADFAITVAGDSMSPEYPSGTRVLIKKINEKAFIDWGKVFVLDTCNGIVVKQIFPTDDSDPTKIKCVSINEKYPPFEVCFVDIFGMYRVLLSMSTK